MRIVIIGNAGSGKSFLATKLEKHFSVPKITLDEIFWSSNSYTKKRNPEEVISILTTKIKVDNWIIEGVFGELIEPIINQANLIIWLDLNWQVCRESIIKRQNEQKIKKGNFQELLKYAENYWNRQNKRSWIAHQQLYNNFSGDKYSFKTRKEVNDYIKLMYNKNGLH